ncbi:MAG: VWA domain-containing protein [Elusimicrobia bacterium]|nr:VWA domain-containing protein [Elusimicrobiota bacterium]
MTLAHPWLLLWILPLFAILLYRKRFPVHLASLSFSREDLQAQLPISFRARWRGTILQALRLLACLLLVVALARPQKLLWAPPGEDQGIDILLALDTSASMQALDFNPDDRLQAAKKAAAEFIRHRPWDRIGIVVFAGTAFLQCPLTRDHEALLEFLELVRIGMTEVDGTAIGNAIATATHRLQASPSESKVLILLTDGRNNAGEIDPATAAKAAQSFEVKIYTIGTGGAGPALFPVEDPILGKKLVPLQEELDEKTLQQIARLTGGEYFRATDALGLKEIYRQIDRLEKTEFENPPQKLYQDLHLMFLTAGLLLLILEIFLGHTLLLKIP